ncbi:MAG TPA: tRNA (adenosine(37)-N6)-threonylcarbamoyltransferase complex dimerization subunit type 1 TsaB [Phycisphaerales bacterium]|nr:tRNA (adenosine(37)-N6)-threonylcarbamoyltransferase complex dimerization subunit type 1 TsaB [Phycisphaerales bacterium]
MPWTLAIETSNPSAWEPGDPLRPGIALLDGDSTTHVEEIDPTRIHEDELLPAIDRLTRRASLTPRDITRIAVSAGPGGFTAVRMAITIAKTIADVTSAHAIAVPTAHSLAAAAHGSGRALASITGPFAVALASKGDTAWIAHFDDRGQPVAPGEILHAADLARRPLATLIADRFLPLPFTQFAQQHHIPIQRPIFDPVACARASLTLHPTPPAQLLPLYPRPPEAIRKWRELHGDKPRAPVQPKPTA